MAQNVSLSWAVNGEATNHQSDKIRTCENGRMQPDLDLATQTTSSTPPWYSVLPHQSTLFWVTYRDKLNSTRRVMHIFLTIHFFSFSHRTTILSEYIIEPTLFESHGDNLPLAESVRHRTIYFPVHLSPCNSTFQPPLWLLGSWLERRRGRVDREGL